MIAQKGKGKTISSKAVDKSGEKDYDNTTQYSRRVNEDGREEDGTEHGDDGSKDVHERVRSGSGVGGRVSYSDDAGGVRELSEIVGRGEIEQAVGKENIQSIREQLTKLYDGVNDGIANGVAIENGDTIYIIDSGKDN